MKVGAALAHVSRKQLNIELSLIMASECIFALATLAEDPST
jgi:hypothetical protein